MTALRGLLQSGSFCCCVPVRVGFVLLTLLTLFLSGATAVIIWFEVAHAGQFSTKERVAFVLTGVVESLLFCASTLGFIGVVARKQLFAMVYTYFLYLHFVLNVVVGIYFLVTVRESNRQQLVDYCSEVFDNTSVESSCSGLMGVSTYVFIAIVAALLLLELYATLIATRYVYHLRMQKRGDRSRRLARFHALSKPERLGHARQASDNIELLHPQNDTADLEDVVFDIRRQTYLPVSTHDHQLPPPPAHSPTPPYTLSDTASARRIRALPPRPAPSPVVTDTQAARLPNPHKRSRARRSSGSESDERHSLYTTEVSTNAHMALMDHATYMESLFAPVR